MLTDKGNQRSLIKPEFSRLHMLKDPAERASIGSEFLIHLIGTSRPEECVEKHETDFLKLYFNIFNNSSALNALRKNFDHVNTSLLLKIINN